MQASVERLNDSIRTYVLATLGTQAQTRSNSLKTGKEFEFLADIEDAIALPVDIPSSISRYQKTLQYASTPLEFVSGIGFYLSPSDMALHRNIQRYNKEIQTTGSDAVIRHNPGLNEAESIASKGDKDSKVRLHHQPGPFTRGRRLRRTRRESAQLTATARQR